MNALAEKLIKNSTIKGTQIITESDIYQNSDQISTNCPMFNVALSGKLDGGFTPGVGVLAGPSKHFKSGFSLMLAKAFLDAKPNGMILFYDSEFGAPPPYFEAMGFNMNDDVRIIHTPITNVEELKFDIVHQLENIDKKDEVLIVIDSIGNLASKKEVEDAKDAKSVADMSRAKSIKSLFRIVTPIVKLKQIPLIAINHTYKEQGMFPKDIVSGGTGIYYSADWIWILGRQQNKKGTEIKGYHFIINVEKSRIVREKTKIPISISFEDGIMKNSGLLEVALQGNYIVKPKVGWYSVVDQQTGEIREKSYREADIVSNDEVWNYIIKETDFPSYVNSLYSLNPDNGEIIEEELKIE